MTVEQHSSVTRGRRRALRREVEVICEITSVEWDEPIIHGVRDLSSRGLWVDAPAPLDVGEPVLVSFRLPTALGRSLLVQGEVVRVTRSRTTSASGMAIELVDVHAQDREAIERFLVGQPPRLPPRRAFELDSEVDPDEVELLDDDAGTGAGAREDSDGDGSHVGATACARIVADARPLESITALSFSSLAPLFSNAIARP